jgi:NAD(P)-dependent dehydrogenase (short-subunit alcohol dehydrogenase family)
VRIRKRAVAGAAAAAWLAWRSWPGSSLHGRAAFVTGGSRGLGFLIARRLLDEGCRVAICGRDRHALQRARRRLAPYGQVVALRCDVADADQVERTVRRIADRLDGIDILVNNASVIPMGPLDALDTEDFSRALDINFWGVFHTTMAVLPHMRAAGGGRIANITSIGGKVAVPHLLPYDVAKFAVLGFSEGLTAELARYGIAVTTVVPGLMRTGSPLHVGYKGNALAEFTWFAAADLLPITAMSAERAARRIVRAIRRRETEVTLTWQAKLLRITHGVAPGITIRALGLANRLLPADAEPVSVPGRVLLDDLPSKPLRRALDVAARHSNQV